MKGIIEHAICLSTRFKKSARRKHSDLLIVIFVENNCGRTVLPSDSALLGSMLLKIFSRSKMNSEIDDSRDSRECRRIIE